MRLLPLLSTSCIVISAVLIAVGWYLIVRGKRESHQKVMMTAAFFALTFFILYMSRTIFIGNTAFGGPESVERFYTIFLVFHIFLATTGGIFGIVTLVFAFKKNFASHRKIGPWTAVIWFFTAITGVFVYLFLYVFYEPGTTTNMLKAIFGA